MYFLHFATPASVPTVVFAAAYPRTGPNGSSHSAAPGHAARGVIYRASAFQLRGLRACLTALWGSVIRSIAGHEAEISGVSGTGLTDLLCGGPFRFEPSCASIQKAFLCLGTERWRKLFRRCIRRCRRSIAGRHRPFWQCSGSRHYRHSSERCSKCSFLLLPSRSPPLTDEAFAFAGGEYAVKFFESA